MRLAVLGRQPLDQLEAMVVSMFSAVPNHNLPVPSFPGTASVLYTVPCTCVCSVFVCGWGVYGH